MLAFMKTPETKYPHYSCLSRRDDRQDFILSNSLQISF